MELINAARVRWRLSSHKVGVSGEFDSLHTEGSVTLFDYVLIVSINKVTVTQPKITRFKLEIRIYQIIVECTTKTTPDKKT